MKIVLTVTNENPFQSGWLACHMGVSKDCLPELTGMHKETFEEGFRMREETADMEIPDRNVVGTHGGCHCAFLMEKDMQDRVQFIRHKVEIKVKK